jgi:hypothetical protein
MTMLIVTTAWQLSALLIGALIVSTEVTAEDVVPPGISLGLSANYSNAELATENTLLIRAPTVQCPECTLMNRMDLRLVLYLPVSLHDHRAYRVD